MSIGIGARLGQYEVTASIGKGGMGEVWSATDTHLERPVAIKVLLAESLRDPIRRKRFEREAKSAAALNHPNICTIHQVGIHDGEPYIVMEYLDGQSLKALIGSSGLSLDQVLQIGRQVAAALAHAHAKGIVHRDLTHTNVVVTGEGVAKVLDFGLAKRYRAAELTESAHVQTWAEDALTQERTVAGTPASLAPELLLGKSATTASDVWAFGVLLYRMVSGRAPFSGETVEELVGAILHTAPPELPSDTPVALRALIERCLDKDPDRRFRQGGDVHRELSALDRQVVRAAESETVVDVDLDVNADAVSTQRTGVTAATDAPSPADALTTDPESIQRLTRLLENFSSVTTVAGLALSIGLVTLFLGFVTGMTFDLALHLPPQSTPVDYLALGARSLIPVLVWIGVALAGGLAAFSGGVVVRWVLARIPGGTRITDPLARAATQVSRAARSASPGDRGLAFLLLGCVSVVILIAVSWDLINTIVQLVESAPGTYVDTSPLGASYESYQNLCVLVGAALLLLLSVGWLAVFGSPFSDPVARVKVARSMKVAGVTLIVMVAAVTTVPWRLLWNNHSEPAAYRGQPAFVVREADGRLYLWVQEGAGGRAIAVSENDAQVDRSLRGAQERIFDTP